MKTAVVIGGNFAGMTAALELKRKDPSYKVIMIDKSPLFLFIPSLIWVTFGRRDIKDISLRKDNILEKKGVDFVHAERSLERSGPNYLGFLIICNFSLIKLNRSSTKGFVKISAN